MLQPYLYSLGQFGGYFKFSIKWHVFEQSTCEHVSGNTLFQVSLAVSRIRGQQYHPFAMWPEGGNSLARKKRQ